MMTLREIQSYDNQNMYGVLQKFSAQISEAYEIAHSVSFPDKLHDCMNIVISGLGGSAIGGDLLRSFVQYESSVPVFINRNYRLPQFVNEKSLVVISSYSGNTEESLSAYEEAKTKNAGIVCLTSGGKLQLLAENENRTLIKIPKGYQPRCAIAYSFFPLLIMLSELRYIEDKSNAILSLSRNIVSKTESYASTEGRSNSAMNIAKHLENKIPVIYSSCDLLDAVNLRWRCQMNENSKVLAFGNLLPEMNHNEIVGWQVNPDFLKKIAVISLADKDDHPRIRRRQQITLSLITNLRGIQIEAEGEGETKLERIFDLIHMGDWISFYLAILYKTDPTPVEKINILKNKLTEI